MSQVLNIKPLGIDTFHNQLSVAPPGSLAIADDVVIDRDGVIESRRGNSQYGSLGASSNAIPQQLLHYKNTILGMIADELFFDTGTADINSNEIFDRFSGLYQEVQPGLRIKGVESNGNFYFTTLEGIKKIGAVTAADFNTSPGFITDAGGIPAITQEAWIDYSSSGWFTAGSAVGYETVWGIKDLNTNVILGNPSSPTQLTSDPTTLLVTSLNQTLFAIDASSSITSKTYFTDFHLSPATATATDLYNDLVALSARLDVDLSTANFSGIRNIASTTPLFFFTGDVTSGQKTIENITSTAGFVSGTTIYDSAYNVIDTIASVDSATQITLSTHTFGASATGVGFYYGAFNSSLTLPQTLITTTTDHNLSPGNEIAIVGSAVGSLNTTQIVVSTPSLTSIVINVETTAASGSTGTIQYTGAVEYQKNIPPQAIAIGSDITNLTNFLTGIIVALEGFGIDSAFPQTSSNTNLKIDIPSGITTSHFYQIYRTALFPQASTGTLADIVIDSEYNLVFEGNPTAADITNGYVFYNDVVSEAFRDSGTPLYTNPNTGQGINQTNDRPPLAHDVVQFYQNVWYANTSSRHSIQFNLISVENLNSSSYLKLSSTQVTNTYNFAPGAQQVQNFTVNSPAASLSGKYFTLSSARNRTNYYAWYNVDGGSVDPAPVGREGIEIDISATNSDSASVVAEKTVAALSSNTDFEPTILGAPTTVTLVLSDEGPATAAADVNTGFTFFTPTVVGTGENTGTNTVLISGSSSVGVAIDQTAQSLVRVINANPLEQVYAFYLSTATTLPGIIYLQRKDLLNIPINLTVDSVATSQEFSPTIQVAVIGNTVMGNAGITVPNTAGFSVGTVWSAANLPFFTTIFSINSSTSLTLTQPASSTVVGEAMGYGPATVTDNEVQPNALFFSKDGQPEAVPLLNFLTVGPKDKAILRIIALRESLMVFKEDAIYRITGTSAITGFTVALFDSSTILLAPDSAVVLNNQIYSYTQQGCAVVSETGVSIVSRPIERDLLKVRQINNYSTMTFGITYEADRAFLLFVPTVEGDTVATQCYRYNTFTQTWTRFVLTKNCGIVNPSEDILYLGDGVSFFVNRERKTFTRTDYADTSFQNAILINTVLMNGSINFQTADNISVGDVVVQTQYLTISQYNRLLQKLDIDNEVPSDNFYATLSLGYGVNLYSALVLLANRLDADLGGTTYSTIVAGFVDNFIEIQEAFNAIVAQLNIGGLHFTNYTPSTGTITFDSNITAINNTKNGQANVGTLEPFVAGPCLTYQHINCQVVTNPQFFGNPGVFRQAYEATYIFESSNFIGGMMGFASDLFPNIDYQPFNFDGIGVWGEQPWSGQLQGMVWGGLGTGVPIRTYIPRNKQRCRWLKASFLHAVAWDQYAFYGISLTYNDYSTRAYR